MAIAVLALVLGLISIAGADEGCPPERPIARGDAEMPT
jgi:hypothetical protein